MNAKSHVTPKRVPADDMDSTEAPGDRRGLNRRHFLGMAAGAAVAAGSATAVAFPSDRAASLASQSGEATVRFMRFAGVGWEHDTIFVDKFMEENPNIKVEAEDVIYAEMFNKCVAAAATGDLADVFAGHNRWAPYLAYKGLTLNLDEAAESGKLTDFEDFFPSAIEDVRVASPNNELHWIPTVVHPAGNAVIVFNMNILNEKGVTPPESSDWTIADYDEIIRAAADPGANVLGTDITVNNVLYTQQYTRTWGSDPDKGSEDAWLIAADGLTMQLESDPVKEGLEWYHGLVKDRLAPTSGEKAALEGSGVDHFSAGMLASKAGTVGAPASLAQTVGDQFEIQAVLWPKGPNGHRGSAFSYNTQSVAAESEHPDEAIMLANYITGPEPAFWTGYEGTLHPMARSSAWNDERLWEKFPVMEEAAHWFESGIDPFPYANNLRNVELQDAWKQETTAYFDGEEEWDDMVSHTLSACQGILDQPKP